MFYVPELSLKGKGPLSRLWQASHSAKNVNRKVATEFKYEDGFEAIIRPSNPQGFALRLRGKLLLGISRLHRAKIHYFSEDIQQTQDRISLSLKVGATVDLQSSKKSKSKVESITMALDDDFDIHFELTDEFPEWLVSDPIEAPDSANEIKSKGLVIPSIGRGSNRSINLPDRASDSGYLNSAYSGDIYENVLEVPGGELPPELEMDFMSESFGATTSKQDCSSTQCTSIAEGNELSPVRPIGVDSGDMEIDLIQLADRKKQTRKRKSKLQMKTEIDRDTYRKWVSGLDEHMMLIVKKPRVAPFSNESFRGIRQLLSVPLIKTGKLLKNFVWEFGVENNPEILEVNEVNEINLKKEKKTKKLKLAPKDADQEVLEEVPQFDSNDLPFASGPFDNDGYGEIESAGGRNSSIHDWPERMRAGSEDGSVELRLAGKQRQSSDTHSLQLRFDFDQSPHGSSVVSQRSRLTSVGELDMILPQPESAHGEADEGIIKEQSLQEESETQAQDQISKHQRLSNNDLHVARCVANELSQSGKGSLSFFQLIGGKATKQQAARVFYSMLALQNDNVVALVQQMPYADIKISGTANTSMYEFLSP